MKLKLTKWDEARWFVMMSGKDERGDPAAEPDDPEFLIRPFPASLAGVGMRRGGEFTLTGEQQWKRFSHCLVDWKGVQAEDGSPLPCDHKIKRIVFDSQAAGISDFVMLKSVEMEMELKAAEKN